MRMSRLITQTRRHPPAESDRASYQLLVRAGFVQPLGAGTYGLLPLGERALKRLVELALNTLCSLEAEEIRLPLIQTVEPWQGFPQPGGLHEGDYAFAYRRLPALFELARAHVRSYRQLPQTLYSVNETWNGSDAISSGPLREKNGQVIDIHQFHAGLAELDEAFTSLGSLVDRFFSSSHLRALRVDNLPVLPGGTRSWSWLSPAEDGDVTCLACEKCGSAVLPEVALWQRPPIELEEPRPLARVATPHCPTIDALAEYLKVPTSRTAKVVFLVALRHRRGKPPEEDLVFALVRGDRQVNEARLREILGADELRPATAEEIKAVGAVPGYASPVGVKGATVVVDPQVAESANLVAGANEEGYHLLNVNYGRDFTANLVEPIALAQAGDLCPKCGGALQTVAGTIVAQAERVGPALGNRLGVTFLNENGQAQPLLLATCRLELSRILACLVEEHHDERGICWPAPAAPFGVHLVILPGKQSREPETAGAALASALLAAGIEPLVDDRNDSPGVKFTDADLIGIPLRLTISERSLREGGVEFKPRLAGAPELVALDTVVDRVRDFLHKADLPESQMSI